MWAGIRLRAALRFAVAVSERISLDPPRSINERALYEKIGWNPHSGHLEVIDSTARNKAVAAGRRFGKSEIGGHKLVQEALNTRLIKTHLEQIGKRREFWIVGPTYTDSEKEFRICYNELTRMGFAQYFDKPGTYNDPLGGNMHISLWGGLFQAHAKSAKHPESLVGEGLSGVILAEAAKLKEKIYTKYVRPTLADYNGWTLMTSTPEGKNWFYEMWKRGQDPSRPDWASWRMPAWRNPYVYPDGATDEAIATLREYLASGETLHPGLAAELGIDFEVAALVGDLTEESFNQEIAALFTEFVGRVFKNFDEELHVADLPFTRDWKTYAAVDYGFTNPSVWLLIQVDPFNEYVRVIDEVYEAGLTIDEFADLVRARGCAPAETLAIFPDPASPGDTRILSEKLKIPHKGGTGGELRWRIDAIRAALKERNSHLPEGAPERVPALQFDRKCVRTINDMLNYRYPDRRVQVEANTPENPMKKDDHGPEALGRFYAGFFGTPDRQARRARARRSNLAA